MSTSEVTTLTAGAAESADKKTYTIDAESREQIFDILGDGGGVPAFKQKLIEFIKSKQQKDKKGSDCISDDAIDKACYLGERKLSDAQKEFIRQMCAQKKITPNIKELPSWKEIQEKHDLLTGDIFRKIAFYFQVSLNSEPIFPNDKIKQLKEIFYRDSIKRLNSFFDPMQPVQVSGIGCNGKGTLPSEDFIVASIITWVLDELN